MLNDLSGRTNREKALLAASLKQTEKKDSQSTRKPLKTRVNYLTGARALTNKGKNEQTKRQKKHQTYNIHNHKMYLAQKHLLLHNENFIIIILNDLRQTNKTLVREFVSD